MAVIYWYLLFALTTAFAAMYELVVPVLEEVALHNPEDNLVQNKTLSYVVFFLMAVISAPFLIIACLVPSAGETFRRVLLESLVG